MDRRASKSITNSLSNLKAYWEIDLMSIKGLASNALFLYTHHSAHKLVARSSTIMPILVLYSSQESHIIICLNNMAISSDMFLT